MRDTCYMCAAPAVSFEHAPPKCFFPKGHRANLITVPSCAEHNAKNSEDVEYVRNIVCTQRGTNAAAAAAFETVKRSFSHSPALMTQTFRDIRPVQLDGEETGAFPIDLTRHKRVMKAIAYALYFHDAGERHGGDWHVFTPSALLETACTEERRTLGMPFADFLNLVSSGLCPCLNRRFSNTAFWT